MWVSGKFSAEVVTLQLTYEVWKCWGARKTSRARKTWPRPMACRVLGHRPHLEWEYWGCSESGHEGIHLTLHLRSYLENLPPISTHLRLSPCSASNLTFLLTWPLEESSSIWVPANHFEDPEWVLNSCLWAGPDQDVVCICGVKNRWENSFSLCVSLPFKRKKRADRKTIQLHIIFYIYI